MALPPGDSSAFTDDLILNQVVEETTKNSPDVDHEDVRNRARQIIEETRSNSDPSGSLAGLQDMHNLSTSMGLPVPRILFDGMVEAAEASKKTKASWRNKLKDMSPITESGCMSVHFMSTETGKMEVAYLILGGCSPGHDLTAELDKIYSRIPEKQLAKSKEELQKHLTMLIHLGRSVYSVMMNKMGALLDEIAKHLPAGFDYQVMGVDFENTTLYNPKIPARRVGIFVRTLDEDQKPGAK